MRRRTWLPFLVLPVGALLALIVSALHPRYVHAYELRSPDVAQAALLRHGQEACEGPIRLPSVIGGAGIWGTGDAGNARLLVSVSDAVTGRSLAVGQTTVPPVTGAYYVRLTPSLPGGANVRVCVTSFGQVPFSLLGSLPTHLQIRMSVDGKLTFSEFSLVLFEPSRHTLLAALPTAFSRAALFRFGWTGPWTFWMLALLLLGTVGSCAWALVAATRADSVDQDESETVSGHPSGLTP